MQAGVRISAPSLPRIGHKLQHITVDAVTLAGGRRAVVEDVVEVDAGANPRKGVPPDARHSGGLGAGCALLRASCRRGGAGLFVAV